MSVPENRLTGSIVDISYRNYDGPLAPVSMAWWVIARQSCFRAWKLPSLKVLTVLSGWYYMAMMAILFFMQQTLTAKDGLDQFYEMLLKQMVWKDQFVHGIGYSQHLLMIVTLIVGAGSIANDNRANALLVYLSKPASKFDYLFGKWLGLFIPIFTVIAIPNLLFYGYGLMTFRDHGFYKDDPYLLLQVFAVLPISAALHASLILAISSLFIQGRVAGAVYAGLYFMGYFFTVLMKAIWIVSQGQAAKIVETLYYCSIDGLQIGLARAIIQPEDTMPFLIQTKSFHIDSPPLIPYLLVVAGIMAACGLISWSRVRAVEVV